MSENTWREHTGIIRDLSSPLRQYLQERYPETQTILRQYAAGSSPILAPATGGRAAHIDAAFALAVRFQLHPAYDAPLARRGGKLSALGYPGMREEIAITIGTLITRAQRAAQDAEDSELALTAWGLASFADVHHAAWMRVTVLRELLAEARLSPDALLRRARSEEVKDIRQLLAIARQRLLPALTSGTPGGTPPASGHCIVSGGTLIGLHAHPGTMTQAGARDELRAEQLHELIACTLLDSEDRLGISRIGSYAARSGRLVSWDAEGLLSRAARKPVRLAEERQALTARLSPTPPSTGGKKTAECERPRPTATLAPL